MTDQKEREAAFARRAGMSETGLERLREADATATWTATCRVCGEKLKGTLAELKAHKHGG